MKRLFGLIMMVVMVTTAGCMRIYTASSPTTPRVVRPLCPNARLERFTIYNNARGYEVVRIRLMGFQWVELQYQQSINVELPVGRNVIGLESWKDGQARHGRYIMWVPFDPIDRGIYIDKHFLWEHSADWGEWQGW